MVAQSLIAALLYILAYLYAIEVAPRLLQDSANVMNEVHETCFVQNFLPNKALSLRGNKYIIGDPESSSALDNCLITFWGTSHYMLYFFLGYWCPALFWPTFVIGVGFEVYEYVQYDCADALDIAFNTIGFLSGSLLKL